MPELPEVQTIVNELSEIKGLTIKSAKIFWERTLATPSPKEFLSHIQGQKIKKLERRGKLIVFYLTDYALLVHLRMTGKFSFGNPNKYTRIKLNLSDGRTLCYDDPRKFGKWHLIQNPDEKFKEIGIDPLSKDYTYDKLQALFKERKTPIKTFLLNQKYLSGLGNIYADEALWEAKIHPLRPASSLTRQEAARLFTAIPKVLQKGLENKGTSLGDNLGNYATLQGKRGENFTKLNVYRRTGKPCPRCGTLIEKITTGQRSTHFCPKCQKN